MTTTIEMLSPEQQADLTRRIDAGEGFLEHTYPGLLAMLDPDGLRMDSVCNCVLGQGGYLLALDSQLPEGHSGTSGGGYFMPLGKKHALFEYDFEGDVEQPVREYGFDLPCSDLWEGVPSILVWDAFAEEWRTRIRAAQARTVIG